MYQPPAGIMNLCGDVADMLRQQKEVAATETKQARNAIKMFSFILSWIVMEEEAESVKATKHLAPAAAPA